MEKKEGSQGGGGRALSRQLLSRRSVFLPIKSKKEYLAGVEK
jgi:hypothetical protein